MDYSKLNFALYARKSTEDKKKQVQSIEDQKRIMKERGASLGVYVKRKAIFTEEKSAKTPGIRPEFARMIADIHEGKYNAIICWQLNRLARNPQESGMLQQMLQDEVIKCIVTNDKTYLPNDNAVLFSVESGISNQFVRDLMVNVRRGMHSKAEKGWLPGVPACGYLNDRENRTIMVDNERFGLVRQMWDYMLTGMYTVPQIARMADKEWGLRTKIRGERGGKPLSTSGVYAMFQNPFYMGYLRYGGKLHKGNHTPMVTPEEFDNVQELIKRYRNPRPKDVEEKEELFPYRGLVKCGECGCSITYTRIEKKQLNGNVHIYEYCYCTRRRSDYDCSQTISHSRITPQELTKLIRAEISKYTIMDDFFKWACQYLDQFNEAEIASQEQVYESQVKTIATIENEIRELGRLRYRNQIDDEFYTSEKQELENRLVTLRGQLQDQEEHNKRHRQLLDKYFNFARYAKEDFESDNDLKKKEVLSIVGQNLLLKDGVLEFEPIKYLMPVFEKYPELEKQYLSVQTYPEQRRKEAVASIISAWYA
jgi:site-specific DNA recombinase